MKNKLCYLVDIVENNEECVILKIKDDKKLELMKLGYFDGDEEFIRLTKGKDHTCTVFKTNGTSTSWNWGESGYTLVSIDMSKRGELIEECITEDFDIYIGNDINKVRKTMNIKSLEDIKNSEHFIKLQYFGNGNHVSVHKDGSFYRHFDSINSAKNHFKELNFCLDFRRKYKAGNGCNVEVYYIAKNKELNKWKEEPYFELVSNLNEINDKDSFTVARVSDGIKCVEFHRNKGKDTIEYGARISDDEWENTIEDIEWYHKDITIEEISNSLWILYGEHYVPNNEYEL